MRENFETAVKFTLDHEGGYENDPDDPGGETNHGISKRYHPDEDIKNMTILRAAQIYKESYWDKAQCDIVPFPRDIVLFECSVNPGVGAALKMLAESSTWQEQLMRREKYYIERIIENPKKLKYFFGWTGRIMDLYSLIKKVSK